MLTCRLCKLPKPFEELCMQKQAFIPKCKACHAREQRISAKRRAEARKGLGASPLLEENAREFTAGLQGKNSDVLREGIRFPLEAVADSERGNLYVKYWKRHRARITEVVIEFGGEAISIDLSVHTAGQRVPQILLELGVRIAGSPLPYVGEIPNPTQIPCVRGRTMRRVNVIRGAWEYSRDSLEAVARQFHVDAGHLALIAYRGGWKRAELSDDLETFRKDLGVC